MALKWRTFGSVFNCMLFQQTDAGGNIVAVEDITSTPAKPWFIECEVWFDSDWITQMKNAGIVDNFGNFNTGVLYPSDSSDNAFAAISVMQRVWGPDNIWDSNIYWQFLNFDDPLGHTVSNAYPVIGDQWNLIELHCNADGTFDAYLNDALFSSASAADQVSWSGGAPVQMNLNWVIDGFNLSGPFSAGGPDSAGRFWGDSISPVNMYARNMKIGTTRHGTELFSGSLIEDFTGSLDYGVPPVNANHA